MTDPQLPPAATVPVYCNMCHRTYHYEGDYSPDLLNYLAGPEDDQPAPDEQTEAELADLLDRHRTEHDPDCFEGQQWHRDITRDWN